MAKACGLGKGKVVSLTHTSFVVELQCHFLGIITSL